MNTLYTRSAQEVFPLGQGSRGLGGFYDNNDGVITKVSDHNDLDEIDAVKYAFDAGVNYVDACHHYGYGKSIQLLAKALEGYKQDYFFINGKLEMEYTSLDEIRSSAYRYCELLGVDYLDSYQIHAPLKYLKHNAAFSEIKKLQDEGVVRHVSISNFNEVLMQEMIAHDITPITHELYYNLSTRFNEDLGIIQAGESHGISTLAYKPIMRNALSEQGIPLLETLEKKYGRTKNQIMLNWIMKGKGFRTLSKSSKKKHIQENIDSLGFSMEQEDYNILDAWRPEGYKTPAIDRDGSSPDLPRAWKV